MKIHDQINAKIDQRGIEASATEVDVVTTATVGIAAVDVDPGEFPLRWRSHDGAAGVARALVRHRRLPPRELRK
jgi:hypothetical protein